MAKALFSQSCCLLTDGSPAIATIRAALRERGFEIARERPAQRDWRLGGPEVVVAYRPEVNGYVAVDVVDRPWPDDMGDPATDPHTFGAWSLGNFGPFAFPGGLARAAQHAWCWKPGREVPARHRGFVRLRLSYVFGAGAQAPVRPADVDAVAELRFLSRIVLALLPLRGVLCCFNPNGEVLRDAAGFREEWEFCETRDTPPLPLWTNVRFFALPPDFSLMDTVGNAQLDLPDVEAIFPKADHDPADVDGYLRNVALYLMGLDRELATGEDIDGPGGSDLSWTVEALDEGAVAPPRRVYRLYPKARREAIAAALAGPS